MAKKYEYKVERYEVIPNECLDERGFLIAKLNEEGSAGWSYEVGELRARRECVGSPATSIVSRWVFEILFSREV